MNSRCELGLRTKSGRNKTVTQNVTGNKMHVSDIEFRILEQKQFGLIIK